MPIPYRLGLAALALSLSAAGAVHGYTIELRDDYEGGKYGSIWGHCQDGTDFEVRWLTEDDSVSYSIGTVVGEDEYDLIQDFCEDHGG